MIRGVQTEEQRGQFAPGPRLKRGPKMKVRRHPMQEIQTFLVQIRGNYQIKVTISHLSLYDPADDR